jgi:hypothetical protein
MPAVLSTMRVDCGQLDPDAVIQGKRGVIAVDLKLDKFSDLAVGELVRDPSL